MSKKDITKKSQLEQDSRDGGISKAGRKRIKKVFDENFVETNKKNKIPSSTSGAGDKDDVKNDYKRKATYDGGVSRAGRKRKKKILEEDIDKDVNEEIAEEFDQVIEDVDYEDEHTRPKKTKKVKQPKIQEKESVDETFEEGILDYAQVDHEADTVNGESVESNIDKTGAKPKKKRKPRSLDSQKIKSAELHRIKQGSALEYLKQWHKRRQEWNFKKLHQIWLLQNMYKEDKITDTIFEVLLKYLENLQGAARERTTKEAIAILENEDIDTSDKKSTRAREILYAIQDS